MKLPRLFHRHVFVTLDPTQLEKIFAMATANTAALTSIAASLATVAEAAVTALGAEPTGDTAATIAAVADAVTSLTSTETALQHALTPPATPLTATPTSLPTPVAETAYSEALTVSGGVAPYTAVLAGADSTATVEVSGDTVTVADPSPVSGTYTGSVTVTDSATPTPNTAVVDFSWTF